MHTVRTSIIQAFTSPGFFAGVSAVVIITALASLQNLADIFKAEELLPFGSHATLILGALTSDAMTLALPIAAALPYTTGFIEDVKSGYIKEYLPRTTVNKYISGKLIAVGLSGGLVLAAGMIAAYALSAIIITPMEAAPAEDMAAEPYLAQVISRAFLMFFSGALWSTAGLALSSASSSRYMAYASPFIIYYVLIILNERYFPSLYVLYPKEWINPSAFWPLGWLGVILLLLELTALAGAGFVFAAKRRIANL